MVELGFALPGGMGYVSVPHLSARVERHATKLLAISTTDGFDTAVLPAQRQQPQFRRPSSFARGDVMTRSRNWRFPLMILSQVGKLLSDLGCNNQR